MGFNSKAYGDEVARVLALDEDGARLMPLTPERCSSEQARTLLLKRKPKDWFPGARYPEAALSGLFLYFSCLEEAHKIAQEVSTPEGSFWHGIMHRQEPDAANAAYWFHRVGDHQVLVRLREAEPRYPGPMEFIDMCENARQKPGSEVERAVREIQRVEWQLLFDWCAR